MMSAENPYQAPDDISSTGLPEAPESYGWDLVDGVIRVEKLSQLPMVDPFTGRTADTMLLQRVEVRYRPQWLLGCIPICIIPLILICGALATAVASADTGIFGSYIEIQAHGTKTIYKG
jgi:hypothetical protein